MAEGENNAKKDVVVEPDATDTSAEASSRLSQAGNDTTYKTPTVSNTDNPVQNSAEVQRILEKFSITARDAGRDASKDFFGAEQIGGTRNFAETLITRDGKKQPTDSNGRPISNGEISTTFRALVDGARRQNPPLSLDQIRTNMNQALKDSGYKVEFDPKDPQQRLLLVDTRNLDKGKPREVGRYDVSESPAETGERMANRALDPTMTVGQQEAFVNRGLKAMLAGMPPGDRDAFIAKFNERMKDSGSNQTLDYNKANGDVSLKPPTDATLPKGLRLENVKAFTDIRSSIANGDLKGDDLTAALRKSTEGMDYRQARLFNAGIAEALKAKYPDAGFGIAADSTGQNQRLEVQVSKQPSVRAEVPAGMSITDARQWAKSAAELQKISGTPADKLQQRIEDFMKGPEGQRILDTMAKLPAESRQKYLDGLNASLPDGIKGEYKLGVNKDGKSVDLIRESSYNPFNFRLNEQNLSTFRKTETDQRRQTLTDSADPAIKGDNRKAFADSVLSLENSWNNLAERTKALQAIETQLKSIPEGPEREAFLKGINKAALALQRKPDAVPGTQGDPKDGISYKMERGSLQPVNFTTVKDGNGRDVKVDYPVGVTPDTPAGQAFKSLAERITRGDPANLTEDVRQAFIKGSTDPRYLEAINRVLQQKPGGDRFQFALARSGGIELQVRVDAVAGGNTSFESVPKGLTFDQAKVYGDMLAEVRNTNRPDVKSTFDNGLGTKLAELIKNTSATPPELRQNIMAGLNREIYSKFPGLAGGLFSLNPCADGNGVELRQSDSKVVSTYGRTAQDVPGVGRVEAPNGLNPTEAENYRNLLRDLKDPAKAPDAMAFLKQNMDRMKTDLAKLDPTQAALYLKQINDQVKGRLGENFSLKVNSGNLELVARTSKGDVTIPTSVMEQFSKLRTTPGDEASLKLLMSGLKAANLTGPQMEALTEAFNKDRPANSRLDLSQLKDGVMKLGDMTVIAPYDKQMVVKGNLSPTDVGNLKAIMARLNGGDSVRGSTDLLTKVFESVKDATVRASIMRGVNDALLQTQARSATKETISVHPGGNGFDINADTHGIKSSTWIKSDNVQVAPQDLATDTLNRLAQNPTAADARTAVQALERNPEQLALAVEKLLTDKPANVGDQLKALYQNGSEATKRMIGNRLATLGDVALAQRVGFTGPALDSIKFASRILTEGIKGPGVDIAKYVASIRDPGVRAMVLDNLNAAMPSGQKLELNDNNELVQKRGSTIVEKFASGVPRDTVAPATTIDTTKAINDELAKHGITETDPVKAAQKYQALKALSDALKSPAGDIASALKVLRASGLSDAQMRNVATNFNKERGANDIQLSSDGKSLVFKVNGKDITVPESLSRESMTQLGDLARKLSTATEATSRALGDQLKTILGTMSPDTRAALTEQLNGLTQKTGIRFELSADFKGLTVKFNDKPVGARMEIAQPSATALDTTQMAARLAELGIKDVPPSKVEQVYRAIDQLKRDLTNPQANIGESARILKSLGLNAEQLKAASDAVNAGLGENAIKLSADGRLVAKIGDKTINLPDTLSPGMMRQLQTLASELPTATKAKAEKMAQRLKPILDSLGAEARTQLLGQLNNLAPGRPEENKGVRFNITEGKLGVTFDNAVLGKPTDLAQPPKDQPALPGELNLTARETQLLEQYRKLIDGPPPLKPPAGGSFHHALIARAKELGMTFPPGMLRDLSVTLRDNAFAAAGRNDLHGTDAATISNAKLVELLRAHPAPGDVRAGDVKLGTIPPEIKNAEQLKAWLATEAGAATVRDALASNNPQDRLTLSRNLAALGIKDFTVGDKSFKIETTRNGKVTLSLAGTPDVPIARGTFTRNGFTPDTSVTPGDRLNGINFKDAKVVIAGTEVPKRSDSVLAATPIDRAAMERDLTKYGIPIDANSEKAYRAILALKSSLEPSGTDVAAALKALKALNLKPEQMTKIATDLNTGRDGKPLRLSPDGSALVIRAAGKDITLPPALNDVQLADLTKLVGEMPAATADKVAGMRDRFKALIEQVPLQARKTLADQLNALTPAAGLKFEVTPQGDKLTTKFNNAAVGDAITLGAPPVEQPTVATVKMPELNDAQKAQLELLKTLTKDAPLKPPSGGSFYQAIEQRAKAMGLKLTHEQILPLAQALNRQFAVRGAVKSKDSTAALTGDASGDVRLARVILGEKVPLIGATPADAPTNRIEYPPANATPDQVKAWIKTDAGTAAVRNAFASTPQESLKMARVLAQAGIDKFRATEPGGQNVEFTIKQEKNGANTRVTIGRINGTTDEPVLRGTFGPKGAFVHDQMVSAQTYDMWKSFDWKKSPIKMDGADLKPISDAPATTAADRFKAPLDAAAQVLTNNFDRNNPANRQALAAVFNSIPKADRVAFRDLLQSRLDAAGRDIPALLNVEIKVTNNGGTFELGQRTPVYQRLGDAITLTDTPATTRDAAIPTVLSPTEATTKLTELINKPQANRGPNYEGELSKAFADYIRAQIANKGKGQIDAIYAQAQALFPSGKNYFLNRSGDVISLRRGSPGVSYVDMAKVDLKNVPEKGTAETPDQMASRVMEPFLQMNDQGKRAQLELIAKELAKLSPTEAQSRVAKMQAIIAANRIGAMGPIELRLNPQNQLEFGRQQTGKPFERSFAPVDIAASDSALVPVEKGATELKDMSPELKAALDKGLALFNAFNPANPGNIAEQMRSILATVPPNQRKDLLAEIKRKTTNTGLNNVQFLLSRDGNLFNLGRTA